MQVFQMPQQQQQHLYQQQPIPAQSQQKLKQFQQQRLSSSTKKNANQGGGTREEMIGSQNFAGQSLTHFSYQQMNTYSTQNSFFSEDRAHKYQYYQMMNQTIKNPISVLDVNHDIFDKYTIPQPYTFYQPDLSTDCCQIDQTNSKFGIVPVIQEKKERRYKRLRYSKNLSKRTSHINSNEDRQHQLKPKMKKSNNAFHKSGVGEFIIKNEDYEDNQQLEDRLYYQDEPNTLSGDLIVDLNQSQGTGGISSNYDQRRLSSQVSSQNRNNPTNDEIGVNNRMMNVSDNYFRNNQARDKAEETKMNQGKNYKSIMGNQYQRHQQKFNQSILEIEQSPDGLHIDDLQSDYNSNKPHQLQSQTNQNSYSGHHSSQAYYNTNSNNNSQLDISLLDDQVEVKRKLFEDANNQSKKGQAKIRLQSANKNKNSEQSQQQQDVIKSLKELQLKKKNQNNLNQEAINNLIKEQKLQEQLREEALIQQYAKSYNHYYKDLEIIEEQVTLSSKDNSHRESKHKKQKSPPKQLRGEIIQGKNSIPKKKLQSSIQKAKITNQGMESLNNSNIEGSSGKKVNASSISNFMMRRSNSQSMFKSNKKKNQTAQNQSTASINPQLLQKQFLLVNGQSASNLNSQDNSMIDQSIYRLDQSYVSSLNQSQIQQVGLRNSLSQSRFKNQYDKQDNSQFSMNLLANFLSNSQPTQNDENSLKSSNNSLKRPTSQKKNKSLLRNSGSQQKIGMEESPYNSNYHVRILHDYFDIDCHQVGLNKDGIPQIKIRKINRQGSQGKLNVQQEQNISQNNYSTNPPSIQDLKQNSSAASLKKLLLSRDSSVSNFNTASTSIMKENPQTYSIPNLNFDSISLMPPNSQKNFQQQLQNPNNQQNGYQNLLSNNQQPSTNQKILIGNQITQNKNFKKFQKEMEQKYLGNKANYQTASNIINTNHNNYMCFGVNIIQKSD